MPTQKTKPAASKSRRKPIVVTRKPIHPKNPVPPTAPAPIEKLIPVETRAAKREFYQVISQSQEVEVVVKIGEKV